VADLVLTGDITPNGATEFGAASSASGSRSSANYSGSPITDNATICSVSYTNNTGAAVTLEIFATCRYTVTGGSSNWICGVKLTGTYIQGTVTGYDTTSEEKLYSYVTSQSLANGATAVITLSSQFVCGSGTGFTGSTLSWTDALVKYNAIKR
jgi:hypothetical protein